MSPSMAAWRPCSWPIRRAICACPSRRRPGPAENAAPALRAQIAELRHLDQTIGLLDWDEETMLPAAGRPQRGEQLATLEGLRHGLLVSDRLGDLVEEVAGAAAGDERWEREIALLRRLRRQAMALPLDLVRAFATARSRSLGAWEEARSAMTSGISRRPSTGCWAWSASAPRLWPGAGAL
jgi:Zn-dependent carboxypeptidase